MASKAASCDELKKLIREVPDFPKKGILFYDITTLLKDKTGFATLIDKLSEHYISQNVDLVLGMEARGFIFAPALAYRLNAGFVPVRKPGKLPAACVKYDYALEYGTNSLEIHRDAIQKGQRVLIVDDEVEDAPPAHAEVPIPVVPASRHGAAPPRADGRGRAHRARVDLALCRRELRKEADHVSDE